MFIKFICIICLAEVTVVLSQSDEQTVRGSGTHGFLTHYTSMGTITGTIEYIDSYPAAVAGQPQEYFLFRGIKYGTPPLREMRWLEAKPVLTWDRDVDATQTKPACPRALESSTQVMNEDCLHLNVYTKNLIKSRTPVNQPGMGNVAYTPRNGQSVQLPLKPVIVFLPGYQSDGAGSYGAQKLMREDLVIVTIEYRVGLLGFLSDGYESLPGNYGVSDILLALKWVQSGIASYGGNPRQVTVAGHDEGASAAHIISFQSSAASLFHQVILLSGSSLCPNAFSRYGEKSITGYSNFQSEEEKKIEVEKYYSIYPYTLYKRVLSLVGCSNLNCLREKSFQELLTAEREIQKKSLFGKTLFTPVIDETMRPSPILRPPRRGSPVLSSILIGSTLNEGHTIAEKYVTEYSGIVNSLKAIKEKGLPDVLKKLTSTTRSIPKEMVEIVYRQYFGEISDGQTNEIRYAFGELIGDYLVNSCIYETINYHRMKGTGHIYAYVFSHSPDPSVGNVQQNFNNQQNNNFRVNTRPGQPPIVSHGDELNYLWDISTGGRGSFLPQTNMNSEERYEDLQVSKNLTNIWHEFARTGTPIPVPRTTNIGNPETHETWLPVGQSGPLYYYNISLHRAGMISDYKKLEARFWLNQVDFIQSLAVTIFNLKGFIVSTATLAALLIGSVVALTFFIYQLKKKKQRVDNGRNYSSWLANINSSTQTQQNINQCS